jgi:hypothetical protein
MGLVKKRKREDLDKDPLSSNGNKTNGVNEDQENTEVNNDKILK